MITMESEAPLLARYAASLAPVLRAVAATAGPNGRVCLIETAGVVEQATTALAIVRALAEPRGTPRLMARLLREMLHEADRDLGDGTTRLALLWGGLVVQGSRSLTAGIEPEQLAAALQRLGGKLSAALDLANANVKDKDRKIADLGAQLNLALANKVNQLEKYRSEFFGKLRAALGDRADIRVVGDRFVVPTDVLFDSGSAELNPGALTQLAKLAQTLNAVAAEIPSNLDWVVRIDGHTDKRPIHTAQFASNWELSTARAAAIVKYLVVQGIPANRLSANGFGQFQPLDPADTEAAYAKNRRIEIQLTNR